jgi:hypothetical protein
MLSLQKVLQYLAQLAGGVVGQENVVALILAVDKNTPIILYANNEDVDLTFKVGSDVVVEASSKTTQDLRIAFEHDREINSQLNPSEIASQSQAQLKKIVAGQLQLSENAAMAVTALVAGRVYKVSQPTDHRYGGYVGYGFIHAEMVLLDYVFSARAFKVDSALVSRQAAAPSIRVSPLEVPFGQAAVSSAPGQPS